MKHLPCIDNAWLACENGYIVDFGEMENFPGITNWKDLDVIDCSGKLVIPCTELRSVVSARVAGMHSQMVSWPA